MKGSGGVSRLVCRRTGCRLLPPLTLHTFSASDPDQVGEGVAPPQLINHGKGRQGRDHRYRHR